MTYCVVASRRILWKNDSTFHHILRRTVGMYATVRSEKSKQHENVLGLGLDAEGAVTIGMYKGTNAI